MVDGKINSLKIKVVFNSDREPLNRFYLANEEHFVTVLRYFRHLASLTERVSPTLMNLLIKNVVWRARQSITRFISLEIQ